MKLSLNRPATVYVALSKSPNEELHVETVRMCESVTKNVGKINMVFEFKHAGRSIPTNMAGSFVIIPCSAITVSKDDDVWQVVAESDCAPQLFCM